MPSGKFFFSSSIVARTFLESSKAFAPGVWKIGMATAVLLFSNERKRVAARAQFDARDIFEQSLFAVRRRS